MSVTTLVRGLDGSLVDVLELDGVTQRGTSFQIRRRFPNRRYVATLGTADAVYATFVRWRQLREAGLTPDHDATRTETLRDAALDLYRAKSEQRSRKTKDRLSPRGLEWWARVLRPWMEGDHAATPLDLLDANAIDDAIAARAVDHPKSAADEATAFRAVVKRARKRGARFDDRLLMIDTVPRVVRRREALTAREVRLLAFCAPPYAVRLILFAATSGLRWSELTNMRDEWIEWTIGTVTIPAEFRKERQGDVVVPLFADELRLLAEQVGRLRPAESTPTSDLPARPAGSPYVFPAAEGGRYAHHQFLRLVWYKARARAADLSLAAGDAAAAAKFERLTPHDLRSTAVTLMRQAGIGREDAATRIGHHDGGRLVAQVYDLSDGLDRLRGAMREVRGGSLLTHADDAAGQAVTPAQDATSSGSAEGS